MNLKKKKTEEQEVSVRQDRLNMRPMKVHSGDRMMEQKRAGQHSNSK